MSGKSLVEAGREAYRRQRWEAAFEALSAADRDGTIEAADLDLLASAAYLTARDDIASDGWRRAHAAFIKTPEVGRAARVGFLLSLTSLLNGEVSKSSGWLERIRRLLETADGSHVEDGFCLVVTGLRKLDGGDPKGAATTFGQALDIATEFGDTDLLALALLCEGQALIMTGQTSRGCAQLDEAMVSVTAGTVSPIFTGIIYCAVILTCRSIFDTRRAREWTQAFNAWSEPQSELVPFRGQCLIHRSEILQMKGDWVGAMEEAERACHWLRDQSEATVGRAHYQKGELHRLAGRPEAAAADYSEAVRHGVDPQPGLALLRLMGGEPQAAVASIRTACGARYGTWEFGDNPDRPKLLGPSVEIFLSAGETDSATAAAEELAACAEAIGMPVLKATSAMATGALLASSNQPEAALTCLKASLTAWQGLDMPYEAARTQVRLAEVCRRLGDDDSADMHTDAARSMFRRLGAVPDLMALGRERARGDVGGTLTRRQLDVLRLLASGRSNRQIALELRISEHTVARHVSNIFDKTGVTSRAAAVTFAHRQNLLG